MTKPHIFRIIAFEAKIFFCRKKTYNLKEYNIMVADTNYVRYY